MKITRKFQNLTNRVTQPVGKMILVAVMILAAMNDAQAAPTNVNSLGTNDPITTLTNGMCGATGVNSYLMNGTLLFISLLMGVIVYGWQMRFGSRDASKALTAAVIGTLIVGGSTTLAKTFITNTTCV